MKYYLFSFLLALTVGCTTIKVQKPSFDDMPILLQGKYLLDVSKEGGELWGTYNKRGKLKEMAYITSLNDTIVFIKTGK